MGTFTLNPIAQLTSDLSAMAAEFPPVQINGLHSRAGAKVGGDLLAP
jgi:hypothetical protein